MTPSAVRRTGPWIALALLGGLAIWLYEPWRSRPFDILDFSDFLGRLAGGSGFLDRLGELTAFYREQHGRFNVVSYAGLAAKWEIFGASPLAWQLFRAAQLLTAAGLTYLLLRRLSAGATGAVLGAGLVLFSYSSSHAWVRLTLGEPLGLLCVLLASLLAVQSRTDREWRVLAIASGLLVGIAILAKEMLVAWAPIVAYLGCVVDEKGRLGALGAPDRQGRWVLASVGIATAAASIPVIVAVMG
ncbi:MAG: phospholipid carrier-dependent glycosyltransferase, partial [Gemmatimonadales bacterium]